MTINTERISTHDYHALLYGCALHPELFPIRDRHARGGTGYEVETWLMRGGHVVMFGFGSFCSSELVIDRDDNLPTRSVVTAFPCAGEREFEHRFGDLERGSGERSGGRAGGRADGSRSAPAYMTNAQTETLSENLYRSTLREMEKHATENESLACRWETPRGQNLSLIDVQPMSREVHFQAYHLIADGGFVLRTQSIFECG
ncbi:MAG: hypothetical protein AAF108_02125 [Planctomycetota bacterium]